MKRIPTDRHRRPRPNHGFTTRAYVVLPGSPAQRSAFAAKALRLLTAKRSVQVVFSGTTYRSVDRRKTKAEYLLVVFNYHASKGADLSDVENLMQDWALAISNSSERIKGSTRSELAVAAALGACRAVGLEHRIVDELPRYDEFRRKRDTSPRSAEVVGQVREVASESLFD